MQGKPGIGVTKLVVVVFIFGSLALFVGTAFTAQAEMTQSSLSANAVGELFVAPRVRETQVGRVGVIGVKVDAVSGLYGADVRLAFNPNVISIRDRDSGTSGVQVGTGTCPQPGFVVLNNADNAAGLIDYAAVQLNPQPACNSGVVAIIEFKCENAGVTDIRITSSLISDANGNPLAYNTSNGAIRCTP